MDRAEVISVSEKVTAPAGTFENCVHILETSAPEKGLHDHKWYAPGVGQLKDVDRVLVKYGKQGRLETCPTKASYFAGQTVP